MEKNKTTTAATISEHFEEAAAATQAKEDAANDNEIMEGDDAIDSIGAGEELK
jgi:hypothetical protein